MRGRRYLVRADTVHPLRANGQPSRSIVARLTPEGLQVTGNGTEDGHQVNLLALADGRGTRVEAHCTYPGCGRALTDPESVAAGLGPEHRKAVA